MTASASSTEAQDTSPMRCSTHRGGCNNKRKGAPTHQKNKIKKIKNKKGRASASEQTTRTDDNRPDLTLRLCPNNCKGRKEGRLHKLASGEKDKKKIKHTSRPEAGSQIRELCVNSAFAAVPV